MDAAQPARAGVPHAVVVGGGITGLAAAHRLLGAGYTVTLAEASERLGGKLLPGEIAGVRVDLGAESLLARRPEAVELARAAGLGARIEAPATASASLWTGGALRPMPKGHVMGVPGDPEALAGVLSAEGLARIARERELPPTDIGEDIAVGAYVAERLGREVVDRLVEPLLGGVYAGDAYLLSLRSAVPQLFEAARHHTSLLDAVTEIQRRAARNPASGPVFAGIDGGVGSLPLAVAELVREQGGRILTGTPVTALRRPVPGGPWQIGTREGVLTADAVVLALPAAPAARLLETVPPAAAAELRTIEYASMGLVTLAYRARDAAGLPEGSGFLVPPVEGRTIKAATFAGRKWGWIARQDPELLVLRTSVGRHGESAVLAREDTELVEISRRDLRAATGLDAEPVASRVTRWHEGLPQYPVGHAARVARIRGHLAPLPGLAVCGAAYDGVGVPACIAGARAAADALTGDAGALAALARNPVQSTHGGAGE
ncbi:protoporphyrinogen oxidase [Streptomyces albus]|nr:protoporphyrinogen oxidase [Streptomyces albus]